MKKARESGPYECEDDLADRSDDDHGRDGFPYWFDRSSLSIDAANNILVETVTKPGPFVAESKPNFVIKLFIVVLEVSSHKRDALRTSVFSSVKQGG